MSATCKTGTMGCEGERERQKERQRKYSVKCSSPTPLPTCDPICGLVELKGCRLWRQQLAAFVLVELTGSRAVKLLRGMWFS